MNVGIDFSTAIGSAGLLSVPNDPLAISFDLSDVDEHNFPIEHDASLSHVDYCLDNGDNYSFNETIFNEVLAFYSSMNETSIPVVARAKYAGYRCMLEGIPLHVYSTVVRSLLWQDGFVSLGHGRV